jgi:uncharacterized membrane protein YbhN (UPF0104 family)
VSVGARLGGWARGTPGRVARWAFAILPLLWLSRRVDPAAALRHAAVVGWVPIAAALSLACAGVALGTLRWAVLMRAYGADRLPAAPRMVKDVFVAAYYNLLPSGIAGDVVRALRVQRFAPDVGAALTAIAAERVVGLVALLLIAAGTAVFLGGPALGSGPAGMAFRAGCALAAILATALLVLPWLAHRSAAVRAFVGRLPLGRAVFLRVAPARRPGWALLGLALSFGTQGVAMAIAELLLLRLADGAALRAAASTLPFAILFAYVPITPGAVLQREAVYVVFLGLAGISADRAVAVAGLSFTLQLAVAAIGGALHGAERIGWIRAEPPEPA